MNLEICDLRPENPVESSPQHTAYVFRQSGSNDAISRDNGWLFSFASNGSRNEKFSALKTFFALNRLDRTVALVMVRDHFPPQCAK